jgi:uncharacterized protein with PIN domain
LTPKLYLDEDVSPELARLLRAHGYDVVSVHERGSFGVPDEEHLGVASSEGRTLLTYNYDDFLALGRTWFAAGRDHAGIVVSYRQYRREELGLLVRLVLAFLARRSAEDLANVVEVLDAFRSD